MVGNIGKMMSLLCSTVPLAALCLQLLGMAPDQSVVMHHLKGRPEVSE